ncbi:type I-C CRISPR-associated protein Cas8c/Csd1, partial [Desulfovibrio sp.]
QKEHKQVVRLGEDSIVFWTDRACAEESLLGALFDGLDATEQTQDSALLHKVRSLLTAMACGRPVSEDDGIDTSVRFFVLGLAPNAARLGVRLWVTDTFGNLLQRFGRWYRDLAIERRYPGEEEHPALWQLLRDLAPLQKSENIPPLLGGQLLRSILLGRAWPQSMYTAALQRIHADKNVTYYRAALIKAHLCDTTAKGATMSLDKEEQNKGYRLGRLFAVLEKAQTDALGSVNTSLRERYIGAASTRPCLVFPQLLKTAQFHISKRAKQHPGYDIRFSRLVSEIMDGMTAFPPVLSLEDQGRFMLGYYHQNNALYQKKTADDAEN